MKENAPCKNCSDRHIACHGSCDKYKEWKARYQAQQKYCNDTKSRMFIPLTRAKELANNRYLKHPSRKPGGCQ